MTGWRTFLGTCLVLAAAATAFAAVYAVGDDVADCPLAMADGKERKLSNHDGSAVLLFFYGTWSRESAPVAKKVDALRERRAKQKLVVLGIARDATAEDALRFAKDHGLAFPQATDAKAELYGRFAAKGLPWVALLDGKRKLRHSAAGFDEEAVGAVLDDLLGKVEKPSEDAKAKEPAEKKDGAAKPR